VTSRPSGSYTGRFAPSPTGPLHFGSLVAALASYLDARAAAGLWLVRMEDLDPPRNTPEAASQILEALDLFGLHWDGSVLYQSDRLESYSESLHRLVDEEWIFPCTCPRSPPGSAYDGRCRGRSLADPPAEPFALRVRVTDEEIVYRDLLCGEQRCRLSLDPGDFVVRRKDGLFAYQLAVVIDDAYQQVTRVVRGNDLLDSTARQIYLQRRLDLPTPEYAHIPIVTDEEGSKLSKQTFAPPLVSRNPARYLAAALTALGMEPPAALASSKVEEILAWGVDRWNLEHVPRHKTILEANLPFLHDSE